MKKWLPANKRLKRWMWVFITALILSFGLNVWQYFDPREKELVPDYRFKRNEYRLNSITPRSV